MFRRVSWYYKYNSTQNFHEKQWHGGVKVKYKTTLGFIIAGRFSKTCKEITTKLTLGFVTSLSFFEIWSREPSSTHLWVTMWWNLATMFRCSPTHVTPEMSKKWAVPSSVFFCVCFLFLKMLSMVVTFLWVLRLPSTIRHASGTRSMGHWSLATRV